MSEETKEATDELETIGLIAQMNTAYNAKALALTFETAARMVEINAGEDAERWQPLMDMFHVLATASEAVADATESVLGETK